MIKAIIFDCFGVLAENGWGLIDDRLKPNDQQWEQMLSLSHACDRGIISVEELMLGFADCLQIPPAYVKELIDSQRKNYQLLNFITQELKPFYQIAMLSNVGSGFIQDFFSTEELNIFDELVLSSDIGIAKPEPQIFHLTAARLKQEPASCYFIDDSQINVLAAQAEGMAAHLYSDLSVLKSALADANIQLTS